MYLLNIDIRFTLPKDEKVLYEQVDSYEYYLLTINNSYKYMYYIFYRRVFDDYKTYSLYGCTHFINEIGHHFTKQFIFNM